jgi:outer membrane protein assembly factor BamB
MTFWRTGRRLPGCVLSRATATAAGTALLSIALLGGCQTSGSNGDGGKTPGNGAAVPRDGGGESGGVRFVVDPADARDFGYRVDWQYPSIGIPLKIVADTGGAIFAMDELNYLSRHDRESGERRWRAPVGDAVEHVQGIHFVPRLDKVFVLSGGTQFVIDAETGSIVDRQNMPKIAAMDGVVFRDDLIYAARNGQLVWRSLLFDSDRMAYEVANAIRVTPVLSEGVVVVAGVDGTVMALDARRASQLWERRLLDRVVAKPAVGDGVVYVAGTDQHLRAFALREDRTPLWAYLSESRLTESPTVIGERVYQQIPSEGLVAFEALPLDSPGGEVIWRSPDAAGSVLTQLGSKLVAWDRNDGNIEVLDERLGGVLQTIPVSGIAGVKSDANVDANLLFWAEDGRIAMLTPRMAK